MFASSLNSTALVVRSDVSSTDVFSVKGDSGNTLIAGTLEVDSAATFDGTTTFNNSVSITGTNTLTVGTGAVTIDSTVFPRKKTATVTLAATLALNTVTYVNQTAYLHALLQHKQVSLYIFVCNDTTAYNNITLSGTVLGDSGGLVIDTTFGTAQLVYLNATVGWVA